MAYLDDAARVEHQNAIVIRHRLQPVCDGDELVVSRVSRMAEVRTHGHVLQTLLDDALDQGVSLGIDRRGGFVQEEHICAFDERTDQSHCVQRRQDPEKSSSGSQAACAHIAGALRRCNSIPRAPPPCPDAAWYAEPSWPLDPSG